MFSPIPLLNVFDTRLERYEFFVVHATATTPQMTNVDAAWVDRVHKNKGWKGGGYHAVITRQGQWQDHDSGFPTRPYGDQGAHVKGYNDRAFGVSLVGGLNKDGRSYRESLGGLPRYPAQFTAGQMQCLEAGLLSFLGRRAGLLPVRVVGHRDLLKRRTKECPTFDVVRWLNSGWMPAWAKKRYRGG